MNPITKACVVIIFVGGFVASVISVQHMQLGLGKQPEASFMRLFN
jgi:Niemann-Pick C1 protein